MSGKKQLNNIIKKIKFILPYLLTTKNRYGRIKKKLKKGGNKKLFKKTIDKLKNVWQYKNIDKGGGQKR